jgi:DNA-binding NtrC family response regulator
VSRRAPSPGQPDADSTAGGAAAVPAAATGATGATGAATPAPPLSLERLRADFPSLDHALAGAARAAATDAPVLVLGEPGTGRTTVARALHAASPRRAGPLVEVDCAVVPATLFESELFGHRAGAFTGAVAASEGRVGRAAGGTLVLDHLEDLPLAVQPKLLRLVAERLYAPLGGDEGAADVRFVALATPDLAGRVARGAFRGDLYWRLEVVSLLLPPLRERRDELPALAAAVLADLAERFGRPARLSERALAWIAEHPWPGNLTQLRHLLERELILADGEVLDPRPPADLAGPPPRRLVEVEVEEIRRALAHTRGHQGEAAELLGISRKALWEKRRRHGIP